MTGHICFLKDAFYAFNYQCNTLKIVMDITVSISKKNCKSLIKNEMFVIFKVICLKSIEKILAGI